MFEANKILDSVDDIILKRVVGAVGDLAYESTTPLTSKTFSLIPTGISELSETGSAPFENFATAFYLQFVFVFVGSACLLTFAYSWINIKRVERKRHKKYKIPENARLNVPGVGKVGLKCCGKRCCSKKGDKKEQVARGKVVGGQVMSPYAQKPLSPIVPAAAGSVQQVPGPMLYRTGNQTVSQDEVLAEQQFVDSSRYYGAASRRQ